MEILIRGLNLERWSILQENQAHLILNTINWKTGVSPTKNSTVLLHAHFNPRFRKELQYHVPRFLGQHTDAFPFNSQLIVRALKTFMTQVSTPVMLIKKCKSSPGWVAKWVGASSYEPKDGWCDPHCWPGCIQEATDWCFSLTLMFLPPSIPLSLPTPLSLSSPIHKINKPVLEWGLQAEIKCKWRQPNCRRKT